MRLVIPNEKPVLQGLQSYYLHLPKFIEHHRNEVSACAIHLKSPLTEGMLYFDSGDCIGAFCRSGSTMLTEEPAAAFLLEAAAKQNFHVAVYEIDSARLHLWAQSIHARPLHRDLTSDITDLERLITKMARERLNGFIEAATHDRSTSGILFFHDGKLVHADLHASATPLAIEEVRARLNSEISAKGGTFQVGTIPLPEGKRTIKIGVFSVADEKDHPAAASSRQPRRACRDPIPALEDLVRLVESLCGEQRKAVDFAALWRKAALQVADRYGFLDPFAKECHYAEGKIILEVPVEEGALVSGVLECVRVIVGSLGLNSRFKDKAAVWFATHAELLDDLGVGKTADCPPTKS